MKLETPKSRDSGMFTVRDRKSIIFFHFPPLHRRLAPSRLSTTRCMHAEVKEYRARARAREAVFKIQSGWTALKDKHFQSTCDVFDRRSQCGPLSSSDESQM